MNRIIATIVLTFTMLGALVVPAQAAEEPRPTIPAECTAYTAPIAESAAVQVEELKAVYRERDTYRVFFIQQRDRAEAFKAQVARKDATIARLREQLAAARR